MSGLLLHITSAGKAKELDALESGLPMPKIAQLVIGDGTPHTNFDIAEHLVHEVYRAPVTTTRTDRMSLKVNAVIPENVEVTISESGLELNDADRTLFAYTSMVRSNGEYGVKTRGHVLNLTSVVTRQQGGDFTITISPLNNEQIAQQISDRARTLLDQRVEQYLIPQLQLSGMIMYHLLPLWNLSNDLERRFKELSKY